MSWRLSVYVSCQSTPGMNWNTDLIIPFTSVCLTKVQHKPSDSESDTQAHTHTQIHTIHSKEEHYQEKKPFSFSRPGIWNLICDLTEKLPSDLCWVHSLTISVCNFDIWLQSKDSWSHTHTCAVFFSWPLSPNSFLFPSCLSASWWIAPPYVIELHCLCKALLLICCCFNPPERRSLSPPCRGVLCE